MVRCALIVFRPLLRIRENGKIRDSIVPAGDTQAKYIRLWVENYGFGQKARECSVSLDNITFGSEVKEDESSPLLWTDINTYEPQTVIRGARAMMPIDLCAVYQSEGLLHVKSRKATAGWLTYGLTGAYTFEIRTQALFPASNDRAVVDVYYDRNDWTALKVIAFKAHRRWTRVW